MYIINKAGCIPRSYGDPGNRQVVVAQLLDGYHVAIPIRKVIPIPDPVPAAVDDHEGVDDHGVIDDLGKVFPDMDPDVGPLISNRFRKRSDPRNTVKTYDFTFAISRNPQPASVSSASAPLISASRPPPPPYTRNESSSPKTFHAPQLIFPVIDLGFPSDSSEPSPGPQ